MNPEEAHEMLSLNGLCIGIRAQLMTELKSAMKVTITPSYRTPPLG